MLPELFLTTRQKTKIKIAFAKNMSTNIKLIKAQLTKIIQSGGSLGFCLGKTVGSLDKKALLGLAVLPKDVLPKLATKATSSLLHKF